MHSPARTRLALLRLCLIFIALCLVLAHLEVGKRLLDEQTVGLPNPLLGRDPLPPSSDLPFLGITVDAATLAPADQAAIFEQLAATGFGWVRLRVAWDRIEPVPHHYEWES